MSGRRKAIFKTCMADKAHLRDELEIKKPDFSYEKKMTNANACRVQAWLHQNQFKTHRAVLSHAGMSKAFELMCRWPRPSELSKIINCMHGSDRGVAVDVYYRRCIWVTARSRAAYASFVGELGSNFIAIGERFNLMYLWLHKMKQDQQLVMYAHKKTSLDAAFLGLKDLAKRSGVTFIISTTKEAVPKEFALSGRSADFEPDAHLSHPDPRARARAQAQQAQAQAQAQTNSMKGFYTNFTTTGKFRQPGDYERDHH